MNVAQKMRAGQVFVDEPSNQITMLDSRFYRTDTGAFIPSVTTILDAYPKTAQFYDWLKKNGENADEIRDAAGAIGSMVHKLTEQYDAGDEVSLLGLDGRIDYKVAEWKQFERYIDFSNKFKPEILDTEFNIVSEKLGFAGTIDRRVRLNGKVYILDIKTSGSVHDHYWLQLAAYFELYKEKFPTEPLDGTCILWLNAKTRTEGKPGSFQGVGYQLLFPDKDHQHYWTLFQHTQALWNEVNGSSKPNNITYQIKHKK